MVDMQDLLDRDEPLRPELEVYYEEGNPEKGTFPMVRHPLVYSVPHHPAKNAWCNAMLEAKRKETVRAWRTGDWSEYIWLHERAYRAEALFAVIHSFHRELGLTDFRFNPAGAPRWDNFARPGKLLVPEQLIKLVLAVWEDSENIWQYFTPWKSLFHGLMRKGVTPMFDDEAAGKALLRKQPTPMRIFRGSSSPLGSTALSWTLDEDKAEWFAHRFLSPKRQIGRVLSAYTDPTRIVAMLLGRGEQEVVVLPDHVERIMARTVHYDPNKPGKEGHP